MPPIGDTLREARMRQKLDIADVEARTKIRAKYLRALENEEFGMLPGPTFVRTFLRTYAELLGLDPHLLVEEFRLNHEAGGEAEPQPLAAPPRRPARQQQRRAPVGPPGFGTLVGAFVVLVIAVLLVLGLTGEEDEPPQVAPATTPTTEPARTAPRRAPRPAVSGVSLRIAPSVPTYACIDTGPDTDVLFEGTLSEARTFRNRRGSLRLNLGKTSVELTLNGKRVPLEPSPNPVGLELTPRGGTEQIDLGERPCA
jgi:hypothetical protein